MFGVDGEYAIFCLRRAQICNLSLLIAKSIALEEEYTIEIFQYLNIVTNSNKFANETSTV